MLHSWEQDAQRICNFMISGRPGMGRTLDAVPIPVLQSGQRRLNNGDISGSANQRGPLEQALIDRSIGQCPRRITHAGNGFSPLAWSSRTRASRSSRAWGWNGLDETSHTKTRLPRRTLGIGSGVVLRHGSLLDFGEKRAAISGEWRVAQKRSTSSLRRTPEGRNQSAQISGTA
jgi:hypothetical protein